jgi:hypothetical protein
VVQGEGNGADGQAEGVVKGDELHGMIFFHGGADSEFVAKRAKSKPSKRKKSCRRDESDSM